MVRAAVAAVVVATFGTGLAACGGSHKRSSSGSTTTTFALPELPSIPSSSPPTSSSAHGPATTARTAGPCAGAQDGTAAVNRLIAATRDGSTLTFPAGACFRVDGTIDVVGRHRITIDGNGATFARGSAPPRGRFSPQWLVQGSSGVTISDVHVTGPKPSDAGFDPDYEGQPGVAIDNSTDVTFEHSVVDDVWGDFFRISNRTDRVRIAGNRLTEAGRQGLAVVGGSHITFDGNVVTRARRFAVDLEPYPSTPVRFVTITNNRFFDPSIGFVCATDYDNRCARGAALSDVTVEGNIQEG